MLSFHVINVMNLKPDFRKLAVWTQNQLIMILTINHVLNFGVKTLLFPTIYTYTSYTTITNRSLFLSAYNLFASNTCSLFFSHNYSLFWAKSFRKNQHLFVRSVQWRTLYHYCFVHTQLHTRLTEFLLLVVCFVLQFYSPSQSWSRTFVFSPSQELNWDFIFGLYILFTLVAFAYVVFSLSILSYLL